VIGLSYQSTKRGESTIHPDKIFRGLKEPLPSGQTLQLTSVVKYLGLILDKRLIWKMKNVMNKPYRTFWTCGGTFGKT